MCGIAGFVAPGVPPTERHSLLMRMIGAISHRGPDARGFHVDGDAGLAHARLSIIDLATGAQPMCNEDATVWITFNGEIFNYVELRREVAARGHTLRTTSDTEVIIHLYEDFGPDCIKRLNGDFAFAIWDGRKRELFVARDRMGVRPLFYTEFRGGLAFASEVKGLLALPDVRSEIDPLALDQIFTLWFPLPPRTCFKGIHELPPGHTGVLRDGRFRVQQYWTLDYPETADDRIPLVSDEKALQSEVYDLFTDATRIRLRSDVPVGAYLSGGFDSSVAVAAIKAAGISRLCSFSVRFDDAEFDEGRYQQQLVEALGTEHASVVCRASDIGEMFPRMIWHAERPVVRTAPAPLMALSGLVREQGFKVVLTGEGADEAFAGYDIFKEAKLRRFCARQPRSQMRRQLMRRLYPYLPKLQAQPQAFIEAFFAAGDVADPLFSHMPRFRSAMGMKAFLSSDLRREIGDYDALADLRSRLPAAFASWHPLSQAQYLETAYLLPQYILSSQGDRMSMANAVEGRFPFLDHRLVELGARIPAKLKLRVLEEKSILRRSLGPLLPPELANRPKQPYRAPGGQSFFGEGAPAYVNDRLSRSEVAGSGYFDPSAVERLVVKARRSPQLGTRDHMALVGVMSAQVWHDAFVRGNASLHAGVVPSNRSEQEPVYAAS